MCVYLSAHVYVCVYGLGMQEKLARVWHFKITPPLSLSQASMSAGPPQIRTAQLLIEMGACQIFSNKTRHEHDDKQQDTYSCYVYKIIKYSNIKMIIYNSIFLYSLCFLCLFCNCYLYFINEIELL